MHMDTNVKTHPVIAFIFTFYILSFIVDLLPSVRTRRHIPQGERIPEMAETPTSVAYPANQAGQPDVMYEEPLTRDSMGDTANTYRGQVVNGGANSSWPGYGRTPQV